MSDTSNQQSGFTYFPGDYRWSAALRMALSAARGGGAELGEVDLVGQRLSDRTGDDEAWFHVEEAHSGIGILDFQHADHPVKSRLGRPIAKAPTPLIHSRRRIGEPRT